MASCAMSGGWARAITEKPRRERQAARRSVSETFSRLKERGEVAFIPYICAGDPDLATTAEAARALEQAGADIIEIGIPYTDPLADGPTIQAASARALQGGAGVDESLRAIGRASSTVSCPIVVLAYYNTVLQRGFGRFASRLKACGASGLLIPDVPLEEAGAIRGECELRGVELSLLATPATPDERLKLISSASSGFVYLVAVTGVTGERKEVSAELPGVLKRLKSVCELPIAVGFGVSAPEHAAQLAGLGADGVIVGSALVKRLGEAPSVDEGLASMSELASSIHSGIPDPASAP